mmetsp:Transcript_24235/g.57429  ORF Transcript_24235/g.57429 Transcript_24235/m.57429 type:complete len:203 (+) Transcript_24235:102-710(+)
MVDVSPKTWCPETRYAKRRAAALNSGPTVSSHCIHECLQGFRAYCTGNCTLSMTASSSASICFKEPYLRFSHIFGASRRIDPVPERWPRWGERPVAKLPCVCMFSLVRAGDACDKSMVRKGVACGAGVRGVPLVSLRGGKGRGSVERCISKGANWASSCNSRLVSPSMLDAAKCSTPKAGPRTILNKQRQKTTEARKTPQSW